MEIDRKVRRCDMTVTVEFNGVPVATQCENCSDHGEMFTCEICGKDICGPCLNKNTVKFRIEKTEKTGSRIDFTLETTPIEKIRVCNDCENKFENDLLDYIKSKKVKRE